MRPALSEVLLAENGLAGVELFKERQTDIDLVLLDMIMPEMNGRDCFLEMKKIDPNVRVVLSSGLPRRKGLKALRAAGLIGFIRKPYRSVTLSQTVAAALGTKNSAVLWGG